MILGVNGLTEAKPGTPEPRKGKGRDCPNLQWNPKAENARAFAC